LDAGGRVWNAGHAPFLGDLSLKNSDAVEILPTPDGFGYYIVDSAGGVFTYGLAKFMGSTGGNRPAGDAIIGAALSYDGLGRVNGYWMVGASGDILAFGRAQNFGPIGKRAVSMTSLPSGNGYAVLHSDGTRTICSSDSSACAVSVSGPEVISNFDMQHMGLSPFKK
jgi:hypothetical protein